MLRLKKYLKPYLLMLLLAVALLFLQANADLALPDYMSRIVNVGIQQGGIESSLAKALRAEQMERLLLFMTEDEGLKVQDAYTPETAENGMASYRLKELTPEEVKELEPAMAKAFLAVGMILEGKEAMKSGVPPSEGFGTALPSLPEGVSPLDMLKALPTEARLKMIDTATASLTNLGPGSLNQAAVRFVAAEYEALGMDIQRIQTRYILSTGGVMLLLTLVAALSTILVGFLSARIAAGLARDLRSAIFCRVQSFSSREMDTFSTASLITRSTNDIMQIQMVMIMMIRMVFYAPIIGVGGVLRAMSKNSSMWWIIAAAVGVLSLLALVVYKVAVPKFKTLQKLMDRLNLVSREGLSGMLVIRAFNRQEQEEQRFDRANSELTDTLLFVNRVMVIMMPLMMLIMNGLSILVIWVGAGEIASSSMQVGDMMAFLQYTMQIVMAFLMLSMMFIMIPRAAVSADRVAEVLETEPTVRDPQKPLPFSEPFEPTLEFDHVSFRYPSAEEDVLHDISFTARPGETTAVIGSTGCGKSTLVHLIPRFYDVTGGSIRLGGRDIREITRHDLREKIGYIPQKATLFTGSLADNLRYGRDDADETLLEEALKVAQGEDLLKSREEGMAAMISQGGSNLSGGQKQRLSIARALVKAPPVYIFDESFSALDYRTDARLRRALKERTGDSTVIIVSQRISTVKKAEQIIVLEDGRVVGRGTHEDLMKSCETYREIAFSQLSLEELS
ncbi:MAG: ABC transporter ATP-binding protein [Spirochaetales bacterium]|nr:ABC transporter ATP-binding protein [Spirochaetales bacterium]